MRRNAMCSLVLAAGVFLVASSISAHHGVAHYDMKKTIVLTGTITAFDWGNPHCLVHLDVMDDTGNFRHWTLEMSSTSAMSRRGWVKATLKRGDQVIVLLVDEVPDQGFREKRSQGPMCRLATVVYAVSLFSVCHECRHRGEYLGGGDGPNRSGGSRHHGYSPKS